MIKYKKVLPNAKQPKAMTSGAAGLDMYAAAIEETATTVIYDTGIAIQLHANTAGLLLPRSSTYKSGQILSNSCGLVDSDYRGTIKFIYYKIPGSTKFEVGDRIGQLLIIKHEAPWLVESAELDSTERGEGSMGSTGK
jgi:dUTP pyrophosphatase